MHVYQSEEMFEEISLIQEKFGSIYSRIQTNVGDPQDIHTLNILFLNVYAFLCKAGTEMGLINKTQYLRITRPSRWMKTLITQFKNA